MGFTKLLAYFHQQQNQVKSRDKKIPISYAFDNNAEAAEKIAELEGYFETQFKLKHAGDKELIELMARVIKSLKDTLQYDIDTHQVTMVPVSRVAPKQPNIGHQVTQLLAKAVVTSFNSQQPAKEQIQNQCYSRSDIEEWNKRYVYLDRIATARLDAIAKNVELLESMLKEIPKKPTPEFLQDIATISSFMVQNNRILNLSPSEQLMHVDYLTQTTDTLNTRISELQKKAKTDNVKFLLKVFAGSLVVTGSVAAIVCLATPLIPILVALSTPVLAVVCLKLGFSVLAANAYAARASVAIRDLLKEEDLSMTFNCAMQRRFRLFDSQIIKKPDAIISNCNVLVRAC